MGMEQDTGEPITCLQGHTNGITSLAYSPDGKTIARKWDKTSKPMGMHNWSA